jgi:hypothetical protein
MGAYPLVRNCERRKYPSLAELVAHDKTSNLDDRPRVMARFAIGLVCVIKLQLRAASQSHQM